MQLSPVPAPDPQPRRVLLIGCGSMFDDGLLQLLDHEVELDVLNMAYADEAVLQMRVASWYPQVIVVNDTGALDLARILQMLTGLVLQAALRIVVVRVDDNSIDVYDKQRIVARQSEDFLDVIRNSRS